MHQFELNILRQESRSVVSTQSPIHPRREILFWIEPPESTPRKHPQSVATVHRTNPLGSASVVYTGDALHGGSTRAVEMLNTASIPPQCNRKRTFRFYSHLGRRGWERTWGNTKEERRTLEVSIKSQEWEIGLFIRLHSDAGDDATKHNFLWQSGKYCRLLHGRRISSFT